MARRTLSLLALVAILVGGVVIITGSDTDLKVESLDEALPVELGGEAAQTTPREIELPPADEARAGALTTNSPESVSTSRQNVTEESDATAFRIPGDAIWIEGRVLMPEDTPFEEKLVVIARGRRFGDDRDNPREHRAVVERNGRFRVAFSEDTRKGWIDLEASYLYLPERQKIEPRDHQGTVDLEPRLGGRVHGRALLPSGVTEDPGSFEGCRASLWAWDNGDSIRRAVDMEPDGTFTLNALPVAGNYQVEIDSPRFAGDNLTEQVVKRGEELEVELQFRRGAHLGGRVLDDAGEPITLAKLEMRITRTKEGSTHSQIESVTLDAEGSFDETGIDPGAIVLTLQATGFMELVHDLGVVEDGEEHLGIDLHPEVGKSLSGFVRWNDGSPVDEADVRVKQASPSGDFDWEARDFHAETDEDGAFVIQGLADRPIVVEASARLPAESSSKGSRKRRGTKVKQRLEDVQPGTVGVVLLLSEGTALTGKVANDLGEVVERFEIDIEPLREGYDEYRQRNARSERGFRDDLGEFSISGLAPGRYRARAKAREGGRSLWIEFELPGATPLEFVTPRGITLTGVVRGDRGEAVAGAKVELNYNAISAEHGMLREDSATVRTSEMGEFEFEGAAPGSLYLRADAEGWSPSAANSFFAEAGSSHTDLELVLRRSSRLTGEIHPNAGPIVDRRISCWTNNYHEQTASDASGKFKFDGVPPGSLHVRLSPPTGVEGVDQDELEALGDNLQVEVVEGEDLHIVLGAPPSEPIRVTGRVSHAGKPAAGFEISARLGQFDVSSTTNTEGHYEFIVDGPGDYIFDLKKGKSRFGVGKVVASEAEQRIDIEIPSASIAGIVVGPEGQAASGETVIVMLQRSTEEQRYSQVQQVDTDTDGHFRVDYLFAGEYTMHVGWNGYFDRAQKEFGIQAVEGIELETGQELDGVRIELEAACSFTVIVTTPQGTPVVGARIMVRDSAGRELSPWGFGQTDGAGRLQCTGMPSGELEVRAISQTGDEATRSVRSSLANPQEVHVTL